MSVHKIQLALLDGIQEEHMLILAETNCRLSVQRKGRYRVSLKEHKRLKVRVSVRYDNLGVSKLMIQEKNALNGENMHLVNWVGPSNAIEGYVPRKDRSCQPSHSIKQKKGLIFNDMDFTSCIITGDEYSVSKMPSSRMDATSSTPRIPMGTPSSNNADHQFTILEASHQPSKDSIETNTREQQRMCVLMVFQSCVKAMRKSSLKSSGSRKQTHSVSWADEQVGDHGKKNLCEIEELENVDSGKICIKAEAKAEENNDDSNVIRFASAEACATALNQAAEACLKLESSFYHLIMMTVKGEATVDNNGMVDLDTTAIKWPKKREMSESDILDSTDSGWSPHQMDLWLIYGQDESSHEEYLSINGKEYPQKIILSGGGSSEIKLVLAGYLSRALPGLVAELRLPVPVSNMERALGGLLDTMTFIDPLPSLRMRQWQLITLLFLDALSVCRLPALQPIMTSQRMLLHKVFESAQIGIDEYEVMKDHIIPLGRTPIFAAQSGA
ncbi:unnamed protein product [Rhodiola kirilowii]